MATASGKFPLPPISGIAAFEIEIVTEFLVGKIFKYIVEIERARA